MAHLHLSFAWENTSCLKGLRHLPATMSTANLAKVTSHPMSPVTTTKKSTMKPASPSISHSALGWSGQNDARCAVLRLVMAWHIRTYARTYNTSYGNVSAMYSIQYFLMCNLPPCSVALKVQPNRRSRRQPNRTTRSTKPLPRIRKRIEDHPTLSNILRNFARGASRPRTSSGGAQAKK